MRNTAWKIIVLIMVLLMSGPSAFSKSLNGLVSMSNTTSTTEVDGVETLSSSYFSRNFSLSLSRPITQLVFYNLSVRANLTDSETTDELADLTTLNYRRSLEPTLELFVRNNMYDLNVGYNRQEQWSTASYSDDGRLTSEFYYSRFRVYPQMLPSFSLDIERQENFDYLQESETSDSTNSYTVGSSYRLPAMKMKFGYDIVFSNDSSDTPLSLLAKSDRADFSNNYHIGYSDSLWNRKINYSVMYQGNYSRNRNRQHFTGIGTLPEVLRFNAGGLYAMGDPLDGLDGKDTQLASEPDLTDANLATSAGIDLSSDEDNHIGVRITSGKSVDRLRIYVDEDLTSFPGESKLNITSNWDVYKSNTNEGFSIWDPVGISDVNVEYDPLNDKYYYDILLSGSPVASYFKAVNRDTSSLADVDVTEISVWGAEVITEIGTVTDVNKNFTQGINMNAGIRLATKWDLNLRYSVDRTDQDPASVTDSASGIIENMFSNSLDNENENTSSVVTRNYGASARWQANSLLTSTMSISRNEGFNNTGEAENANNSYGLTMNYVPLPTVDTNLTIIRNDSFTDNEQISTNDALLLSADTELHRDVNMVTDIGFSRSENLADGTTSSFSSIDGTIDALITRKITGTLKYGYSINDTDSDSLTSNDFSASLNYQAGRFINLFGSFVYTNSAGDVDMSESIGVDWLPLPKIRLNANYSHSDSDGAASQTTSDTLSGYGAMYITRFANIRFSYTYARTEQGGTAEQTHNINTNLNCRF